ncbi:MAG: protease inhibitor I42 family protein [Saprospiraceae bacterium]|nr:protease inhibitor I42 family protein [Saprospiraceae bacterium]
MKKKLKIGESFEINLEERGTSGLSLLYKVEPDNLISISTIQKNDETPKNAGDSMLKHFKITAINKGIAKVRFYETQRWDKNFPEILKVDYEITIQ